MEEKLNLGDILLICAEYLDNPNDKDKINALEELKRRFVIKAYMPIKQKELVLRKTLIDVSMFDSEAYHYAAALEIATFFDCLLAYIDNLDQESVVSIWKDYDYYDILHLCGIDECIMKYVERDYNRLEFMLKQTLSWDNVKELLEGIDRMSPEKVDELTRAFERFTINADPDMIKNMSNIIAQNDPLLQEVKHGIEDQAYSAIIKTKE